MKKIIWLLVATWFSSISNAQALERTLAKFSLAYSENASHSMDSGYSIGGEYQFIENAYVDLNYISIDRNLGSDTITNLGAYYSWMYGDTDGIKFGYRVGDSDLTDVSTSMIMIGKVIQSTSPLNREDTYYFGVISSKAGGATDSTNVIGWESVTFFKNQLGMKIKIEYDLFDEDASNTYADIGMVYQF